MATEHLTATPATRHDPAFGEGQEIPFAVGAVDRGMMKGTQGAYKREVRNVSAGSVVQPALHGQFIHPIPPTKGDRR